MSNEKKFFITVTYPYVNGYLHLGHAVTFIKAEITARYKKMRGYEVLFPQGFHATGAPIAAAVYKLSKGDEKQIKIMKMLGIPEEEIPKFTDPKYFVEYFVKAAKEDLSNLGLMIDWDRTFYTTELNPPYSKFIEWQYFKLRERGYIYKGSHPVVWDPVVNLAIGDHDRPGEYEGVRPVEGLIIKFKLTERIDGKEVILPAFTLRPETVFGVVNIWINPDAEYEIAKVSRVYYKDELYTLFREFGKIMIPVSEEERKRVEELITQYSEVWDKEVPNKIGKENANKIIAYAEGLPLENKEEFIKKLEQFIREELNLAVDLTRELELLYNFLTLKVKTKEEYWVIPNSIVKEDMKHQDFIVEETEIRFKGSELVGKMAKNLVTDEEVPILPAKFVDVEVGTGIVMSVPAHAPYDYIGLVDLLKDEKLKEVAEKALKEMKSLIEVPGFGEFPAKEMVEQMNIQSQEEREKLEKATQKLYAKEFYLGKLKETTQQFANKKVSEAKEEIADWLIAQGIAIRYYTLPVRFESRYGNKVVVKIVKGQWFLKYSDPEWKKLAHECVSQMRVIPEDARKILDKNIDWYKDWAFTHQNELGTRLPWDPKWVIESLSDSTIYPAYYTIAHILQNPEKYGIDWNKIKTSLFDYVFLGKGNPQEVAKENGISVKLLKQMREEFEKWYPLDLRVGGKDMLQNHFIFFIFHHVAIFPKEYWPRGLATNGFVLVGGEKMSKSKGNFITIREALKKWGRSALRFALAYAGNATLDDQNFDPEFADKARDEIIPRIEKYLKMKGYERDENSLDKWIVNRVRQYFLTLEELYENIRPKDIINEFFKLENDFNFYRQLVLDKPHKRAVEYFKKAVKALWPIIPDVVREPAWIGKEEPDEPWIRVGEYVESIIRDLTNVLKLVRIRMARDVNERLGDLVKLYLEGAKLTEKEKEEIKEFIEWKPVRIKIIYRDPAEFKILRDIIPYIERTFGGKVILELASESKEEKASRAKPFKPAFVVE